MFGLRWISIILIPISCGSIGSRIVVIGGGAAGFFSGIEAARTFSLVSGSGAGKPFQVIVLEAGKEPLQKVLISGGGRCNVMHDPSKGAIEIAKGYPRGNRELLSPFNSQFGPYDTLSWFAEAGVELKTEADGRVFPTTDQSSTVIQALQEQARKAGVKVNCGCKVLSIEHNNTTARFVVTYSSSEDTENRETQSLDCDSVIMATGSSRAGHSMLRALGHDIVPALPSLFSFKIDDLRLLELAGVSSQSCVVRLVIPPEVLKGDLKHLIRPAAAATFTQRGPLLVTHQGLSGPAVLKLSAFGAKILAALRYSFTIEVSWVPNVTIEDVVEHLVSSKKISPIALVGRGFPPMALAVDEDDVPYTPTRGTDEGVGALSRRLWLYLLGKAGVSADKRWIDLSLKEVRSVAKEVSKCSLQVTGRGVYRDEFVTCGGVSLQEIEFARMESKIIPKLFLAGEVLDIDGITGGYNFQSAWTGGWIAGHHAALSVLSK